MIHPTLCFAVAQTFTPIFNTKDLAVTFGGKDGKTLPLQNNLLKELEMIAFPHTSFEITARFTDTHLLAVQTKEYPSQAPLFVDERFLVQCTSRPKEREKKLPPISSILETMHSFIGAPYLWGGNCQGVPEMVDFYPPRVELSLLDETSKQTWKLQGMDCSGLLYYASDGCTPRNTSAMISYGQPVPVEGKKVKQWQLRPGDLIVWKGHVIIVLDSNTVIESLGGKGVIVTPLIQRMEEIQSELKRTPLDHWQANTTLDETQRLVVRRWHEQSV